MKALIEKEVTSEKKTENKGKREQQDKEMYQRQKKSRGHEQIQRILEEFKGNQEHFEHQICEEKEYSHQR